MLVKFCDGMTNSVDLGLYYSLRPDCRDVMGKYVYSETSESAAGSGFNEFCSKKLNIKILVSIRKA